MADSKTDWKPPAHPTPAGRHAHGRSLRKQIPRASHAGWSPPADRFDPVALLEEQNVDRLPWLVPVRRGRMAVSPFTFYRGAARIMAADLARMPVTGLTVQACGDAHLLNFGAYASPERRLVFDLNDFDETLPGPWEWDVKRLAASLVIAGQDREFDGSTCRDLALAAVRGYRESMARFAGQGTLDVWYAHLPLDELVRHLAPEMGKRHRRRVERFAAKARSKDSLQALSKLAEEVDGVYRIRSDPPLLVPLRELPAVVRPEELDELVHRALEQYKVSLADNRRRLLDRFRVVDTAIKVVGVGSAGTRCAIALLEGRDHRDPLFLQIKEATRSVLEEHLSPSAYASHGERVVRGQRLMQAVSDLFLGWTDSGLASDRHFYWRQLRDWKGSAEIETMSPKRLGWYAGLCGWTLARAHARSGDSIAIAAYLGKGDRFDQAAATFAELYAEQNRRDHDAFAGAIRDGLAADREH